MNDAMNAEQPIPSTGRQRKSIRRSACAGLVAALFLASGAAHAQWPFGSPSPKASPKPAPGRTSLFGTTVAPEGMEELPPPRDIPLVEKKWDELSNHDVSPTGAKALAINPEKWKHAETENFIIHYRRVTEAQKVVREIEYNIWFVAKTFGATKAQLQRKSHVFVFQDEIEWKKFLAETDAPSWFASFARGDELFLNVRQDTGIFDSHTLAHECTHAVVARLFPHKRWPIWLSEGFAEYMGGASVAARKGQTVKYHQSNLAYAGMPLEQMVALTAYPTELAQVSQLYQTSEKFVRFLFNELPKERFPQFVSAILAGKDMQTAFLEVYGDKIHDWKTFQMRFQRFSK